MHDVSAGARTRAGNAGDGKATTASGAGRAPVNGLPSAASGLEALFDELDAAMSATAGTRDVCRWASTTTVPDTWREMSCVYRVSRL